MNWLRRVRARVRGIDPFWKDAGIALGFTIFGLVEVALTDPHGESRLLTGFFAVLVFVWIAFRRRAPVPAMVGFSLAIALQGIVGNNFLFDNTNAPFVAVLFMLYSLGRWVEPPALLPLAALFWVSSTLAVALSDDGVAAEDFVWIVFMFGLPLVAGRALRSRLLLQRELREKAERAEAEQADRALRAAEKERDRIAAELQAVVANGVSAMVVQAEAVPRVLAGGDTARASESLAVIEETGRDALIEMRRLLGVLRRDGEGPELAPQPGLARLEALVERQRGRGLEIDLRLEGERRDLAPGVDLTAYRVVEDALDAAIEKMAGSASVVVSFHDRDLELEVSDDRTGGPSYRLSGLRDRVGLYGGHLSAGSENGAGFRLRARLPLEEAAR